MHCFPQFLSRRTKIELRNTCVWGYPVSKSIFMKASRHYIWLPFCLRSSQRRLRLQRNYRPSHLSRLMSQTWTTTIPSVPKLYTGRLCSRTYQEILLLCRWENCVHSIRPWLAYILCFLIDIIVLIFRTTTFGRCFKQTPAHIILRIMIWIVKPIKAIEIKGLTYGCNTGNPNSIFEWATRKYNYF